MRPYYDEAGITIYNCDCREILGFVEADAVVTDPPYGIADVWQGGAGHGWGRADKSKASRNAWDGSPPDDETISRILAIGSQHIVWGGNYFSLPPSRCWLVWNKPERGFTLAECELAWTDFDSVARVFDYRRSDPDRVHPTQKPLALMKWCVGKTKGVVFDPYMGSGTTLRAAKEFGRRAIGCDIDEQWCEAAANRLAQGVLEFAGASQ